MQPINVYIDKKNTHSVPEKKRKSEICRNQYKNNIGIVNRSENARRKHMSHPAEPKATCIAVQAKEQQNAFKKQIGYKSHRRPIATTKAENRKGRKLTVSRLTIDTEHNNPPRIREFKS